MTKPMSKEEKARKKMRELVDAVKVANGSLMVAMVLDDFCHQQVGGQIFHLSYSLLQLQKLYYQFPFNASDNPACKPDIFEATYEPVGEDQ